ncbi:MAG: cold shock domain-containing protein [Thermomicrobiales bacterium]
MPTGTVKWYDPDKGFGFVAREDGGGDLFLHHTVVGMESLAEGDRITFSIGHGLKGERAEDIRVVERSGNPARVRAPREFSNSNSYGASRGYGGSRETYGRAPLPNPTTLPQLEGTVRRFDTERGFGFISSTGAAEDVFFHSSVVAGGDVRQGDTVEFRLGQGQKGPRALDVRVISRSF